MKTSASRRRAWWLWRRNKNIKAGRRSEKSFWNNEPCTSHSNELIMNYKRLIALITVMIYNPKWIRSFHARCNTLYLCCGSITKSTAKLWLLTKVEEKQLFVFKLNKSEADTTHTCSPFLKYSQLAQIFHKFRRRLKITGTRRMAWSMNYVDE
jgi:hypothetical protein